MPTPANSTAVLRPELAVCAYEYVLGADVFIGPKVLPVFETDIDSGEYPVIPVESLLSLPETVRKAGSAYSRDDFVYETDDFVCKEHGFEEPVDDSHSRKLSRYFDVELVATQRCMDKILRAQEKRTADMLYNESTFTPHNVTAKWNDAAASDPLADVNAGKEAIEDLTGISPNTLVINKQQFRALGLCEAVIDRIKFTNPNVQRGQLPAQLLAQYFDVEQVLVAGGVYNSANKGLAASIAKIWSSSYAMLCISSHGGMDLKEPSLGRTFLWTQDSPTPVVVESYREEQIRSNVIRARQNTAEKLTMAAAGYLLKGVIA